MSQIVPSLLSISDCLYRVSAKAIIIQNSEILVVEEEEGWFGLPGGGIEHDETIETGLLREISEEINVDKNKIIIGEILFIDNKGILNGIPKLNIFFKVTIELPHTNVQGDLKQMWMKKEQFNQVRFGPSVSQVKERIAVLF